MKKERLTVAQALERFPLNGSRFAELAGVNPALLRYYKTNENPQISKDRKAQIEKALHDLGAQLQAVEII